VNKLEEEAPKGYEKEVDDMARAFGELHFILLELFIYSVICWMN
jgi:hypothetical protein